jgi:hypothetical protein
MHIYTFSTALLPALLFLSPSGAQPHWSVGRLPLSVARSVARLIGLSVGLSVAGPLACSPVCLLRKARYLARLAVMTKSVL